MTTRAQSVHDKEMASRMKQEGTDRHTGRCPICYGPMPNGRIAPAAAYNHILACKGPARHTKSGC